MTTTIVKRTPFRELDSIERRMWRMLDGIGVAPVLLPAADVYETADEVVVALDVPGFEEKELEIEVSDHTLKVTGARKEGTVETEKEFHLQERLELSFERRFVLPTDADTSHVKAVFTKGVLEVHAPKLPTTAPTKVEITNA
jgi:HSP20 family protein